MTELIRISLSAARVNAGMSQQELADALNVSKSTISAWENYKTPMPVDKAEQMSNLYGLPMECIKFTK